MALDDAVRAYLEQMALAAGPDVQRPLSASGLRIASAQRRAALRDVVRPPVVAHVNDVAGGEGANIPIRILLPRREIPEAMIVYYHGGGWVVGQVDDFDAMGRALASRTGCGVALVGYRLAPEHAFPAALDDAWDALLWVDDNLEEIAGARAPLVVAGDSAGGSLAASVTHRARDHQRVQVAAQVLINPVTDFDPDTDSYLAPENQLALTRERMLWFWDQYVPDVARRHDPEVSVLRSERFDGLPPTVVLTAEHDVLHDEGEEYARRLEQAGVHVFYRRFAGQMHGLLTTLGVLPGSDAAMEFLATSLERVLSDLTSAYRTE